MAGGINEQTDKQMSIWQKSWITSRGSLRIIPMDEIYLIKKLAMND